MKCDRVCFLWGWFVYIQNQMERIVSTCQGATWYFFQKSCTLHCKKYTFIHIHIYLQRMQRICSVRAAVPSLWPETQGRRMPSRAWDHRHWRWESPQSPVRHFELGLLMGLCCCLSKGSWGPQQWLCIQCIWKVKITHIFYKTEKEHNYCFVSVIELNTNFKCIFWLRDSSLLPANVSLDGGLHLCFCHWGLPGSFLTQEGAHGHNHAYF